MRHTYLVSTLVVFLAIVGCQQKSNGPSVSIAPPPDLSPTDSSTSEDTPPVAVVSPKQEQPAEQVQLTGHAGDDQAPAYVMWFSVLEQRRRLMNKVFESRSKELTELSAQQAAIRNGETMPAGSPARDLAKAYADMDWALGQLSDEIT